MNKRTIGGRALAVLSGGVLTLMLVGAIAANQAKGGVINVWACHQPNGDAAPLDGWTWQIGGGGVNPWSSCAAEWAGWFGLDAAEMPHPVNAFGSWTFTAPPDTNVTTLRYLRGVGVFGSADYTSFRGTSTVWDSRTIEFCAPRLGCPGYVSQEVTWGSLGSQPGLVLYLRACTNAGGCDSSSRGWLSVPQAIVTL